MEQQQISAKKLKAMELNDAPVLEFIQVQIINSLVYNYLRKNCSCERTGGSKG